jgi:putative ABC transport system permease protein
VKTARERPPAWWLAVASALTPRGRRDEIQGDLIELWRLRADRGEPARRAFWRDVLSLAVRYQRQPPAPRRSRGGLHMWDDLRYGARLLTRQPGFGLLALLTLAIGIGAATTVFTIAERVLLRPLPYPELDRVMSFPAGIHHGPHGVKVSDEEASLPQLASVGLYESGGLNLGEEPWPVRLRAAAATSGFFTTLGVPALIGRTFEPAEDREMKVAILSFEAWRHYFASDTGVVGRTIRLNSLPFTVVGVMPAGFSFPARPDVLVPPDSGLQMSGSAFRGQVIGKLAPGATREQLADALTRLAQQQSHGDGPVKPVKVTPLAELLSAGPRPTLLLLATLAGILLLVACANVAGVLMSRLHVRARELHVRRALGASRRRLVQQLVTESLVLTAAASVAGLALAFWAIRVFAASDPGVFPDVDLSRFDLRFFAIGAIICALATLIFSIGPAISAGRVAPASRMRDTATPSRAARWFGSGLVAGQVAMAMVLVAATTGVMGMVVRLMRIDIGYDNAASVMFEVTLPRARYNGAQPVAAFLDGLEERVRALPGVRRFGASSIAPGGKSVLLAAPLALAGDPKSVDRSFQFRGERRIAPAPRATFAPLIAASPGYFEAMGIGLVAGRTFMNGDGRTKAARAVILSEGAARAIDPDIHSLVGRRLARTSRDEPAEIVGIVKNVRLWDVKNDATRASYQIYEPMVQAYPRGTVSIVVEAAGNAAPVIAGVRDAIRKLDPELPVYNVERVSDLQARYLAVERMTLGLTAAFSAVALILCAIGLYAVLAQFVSQRTREIGIRMALGADRARLRRAIVWQGLRLAVIGILAGACAAVFGSTLASKAIPSITESNPAGLAGNAIVLLAVAMLAAWIPARRASAVDPSSALRAE